ncbi:hypothetical protein J3A65_004743 [Rhizobium sp. PvP014]|nr:hypothetical protein [Rhizobium sp. PvP014]MBP2532282.1 hypothetical protein [Rhizobium sp. PvP099]
MPDFQTVHRATIFYEADPDLVKAIKATLRPREGLAS